MDEGMNKHIMKVYKQMGMGMADEWETDEWEWHDDTPVYKPN